MSRQCRPLGKEDKDPQQEMTVTHSPLDKDPRQEEMAATPPDEWKKIPHDIIQVIALFLPFEDQIQLRTTNKKTNNAIVSIEGVLDLENLKALSLIENACRYKNLLATAKLTSQIIKSIGVGYTNSVAIVVLKLGIPTIIPLGNTDDLKKVFKTTKEARTALNKNSNANPEFKTIADYLIKKDEMKESAIAYYSPLIALFAIVASCAAIFLFLLSKIISNHIDYSAWEKDIGLFIAFGSENISCEAIQKKLVNGTWYEFPISNLLALCNAWNKTCLTSPEWNVQLPSHAPLFERCLHMRADPSTDAPSLLLFFHSFIFIMFIVCFYGECKKNKEVKKIFTSDKKWKRVMDFLKPAPIPETTRSDTRVDIRSPSSPRT